MFVTHNKTNYDLLKVKKKTNDLSKSFNVVHIVSQTQLYYIVLLN